MQDDPKPGTTVRETVETTTPGKPETHTTETVIQAPVQPPPLQPQIPTEGKE